MIVSLCISALSLSAQSYWSTQEEVVDYFEGVWKLDVVSWMGVSSEMPSEFFFDSSTHKYEFTKTNDAAQPLYCKSYVNGELFDESFVKIQYDEDDKVFGYWILTNLPSRLHSYVSIDESDIEDLVSPDSFTITMADVSDPTGFQLVRIETLSTPIVDAGPDRALNCSNESFMLGTTNTSQGPIYTYSWTDASGVVLGESLFLFDVSVPGIYKLTVTNILNDCKVVDEIEVTENFSNPIADPGESKTISCAQPNVQIGSLNSSTGDNISHYWVGPNDSLIVQAELIETVSECGIYTLIVTDVRTGCSSSAQVEVLCNFDSPIANAGPDQDWSCDNSNIVLGTTDTSQGTDFDYTWTNESGAIVGNELMLSTNICGVYLLTVLNNTNGCIATDEVEINCEVLLPYPELPSLVSLDCNTSSIVLQPVFVPGSTEFASFEWTDPNGNVISTEANLEVTECGFYTFTMNSIDIPCPLSVEVNVLCEIEAPTVVAGQNNEVDCETINLDGTGSSIGDNFEYTWLDETGNVVSNELTTTVDKPGEYILVVTNTSTGCTASALVIAVDNTFSAEVNLTLTCTDYIVKAFVDGPGFYQYNWSNGQEVNPVALPFGEAYSVTVTSFGTGCELVLSGGIPEGPAPIASTAVITDAEDLDSGSIDITPTGGTPPYTFLWSNGSTSEDIDQLNIGEYTVTITDANGCEYVETYLVDFVQAIKNIDLHPSIKVYPNPSSGVFTIESKMLINQIEIYNSVGEKVYELNVQSKKVQLNLDVASGIYFLRMENSDKNIYFGKLIIE